MLPDPVRAGEVTQGQPLFLRARTESLRMLEDPDNDIIENGKFCFCNGIEVGHRQPIGPNPQVYRWRAKGQKCDESAEAHIPYSGNALCLAAQAVISKQDC